MPFSKTGLKKRSQKPVSKNGLKNRSQKPRYLKKHAVGHQRPKKTNYATNQKIIFNSENAQKKKKTSQAQQAHTSPCDIDVRTIQKIYSRFQKISQMEQKEEYLGSMDPFVETLLHEFFGL